jgi:hypothetical protein
MDLIIRSPLVEVSPNVYDEYHREDDSPSKKGTNSSAVPFLVKDKIADEERTKDLSRPVHEIVQSPSTNCEDGCVVIVEFCVIHKHYELVSDNRKAWQMETETLTPDVEIVRGEEHGEE